MASVCKVMLAAGKTRSGKTTGIIALLLQALQCGRDVYGSECIIIDPKQAELSRLPHVVTLDADGEAKAILAALKRFANTITQRQRVLNDLSVVHGDAVKWWDAGMHPSFLFADERCVSIFLVVLPGLAFTSVYSVLRGVFWGNKDFLPYSVIELLEEICMIIAGVILVSGAASAYQGAFRAGIAVLISYIFSFSLAAAVFFLRKNKLQNPRTEFRPLLASSAPVTAMRTINSLAGSLVSIIFPLRLVAAGFSRSQAMSLYGAAVGQAIPLLFVPTTLIGSFTLVLVPEISEDFYGKRNLSLKNNVEKAIKFTLLLSAIFVPVFFVCGEEIGILVFGSPECGNYLTAASFLMLFMGLDGVTTSILNSMGKEKKVLMYCAISGIFMLAAIWFLPSVMGVYALLAGYSAVYCVTTALNLILLHKTCPVKPVYIKYALKTVLLIIPAAAFGLMLERMLLPVMGTLLTFLTVSVLTAGFLCLLYMGAGLFDVNIAARFKRNKKRPAPGSGAGNKTAVKN